METTEWTDRLRLALKESEISQDALAAILGVTRGAVGHYLNGRRMPPLDLLGKIAESLSVSLNWLLLGKGPKSMSDASGIQDSRQINQIMFKEIIKTLKIWLKQNGYVMEIEDQIDFALALYNNIIHSENFDPKNLNQIRFAVETVAKAIKPDQYNIKIDSCDKLTA